MVAPQNQFAFDIEMLRRAAENYYRRTPERERKKVLMSQNRYDEVETQDRLAKRVNRLISHLKEASTVAQKALPEEVRSVVRRGRVQPGEVDSELLERVIGATRDFMGVAFLDEGLQANRSVARIVTKLGAGRVGYGTGFLVSPRLLLTNWHVLHTEDEATRSVVEFDYQIDRFGDPLSVERFALEPTVFFISNKELDFALVAVKERSEKGKALSVYGFRQLIKEEGKIAQGLDCLNIIQHPRGEMKQIVIRENRVVDLPEDNDNVAHYEGDTEPGSSGSPVFNDQWEVIALHHQGVPRIDDHGNFLDVDGNVWREGDDPSRLDWVANEGIRISRIYRYLAAANVRGHEKELLYELLNQKQSPSPLSGPDETDNGQDWGDTNIGGDSEVRDANDRTALNLAGGPVTVTIPLQITVSLGSPNGHSSLAIGTATPVEDFLEKIEPDPDYSNRPGYDPDFTGVPAPLPRLTPSIKSSAVKLPGADGNPYELKYYRYSVIMNGARRMAFVSAVNFDADPPAVYKREKKGKEKWFFDPRISEDYQAGEELYAGNPLDRGHLSRRADAAWGDSQEDAKLANDDTFHFTNCSPQHEIFNQSTKANQEGVLLWGDLEEHVAKQARKDRKRLSVFNGPIFRSNDRKYRGVQLPKEFYKIIVFENAEGKPRALAFLLSQASLVKDLPMEEFEVGPYEPFQVPVREIESKTKLDFGKLRDFDPLEYDENESFMEAAIGAVRITSSRNIVF
jgi:endonuclease G, mitochondrial